VEQLPGQPLAGRTVRVTGGSEASAGDVGITLTGASIVIMPLLARAKRRAGRQMNSRLVVAEATETNRDRRDRRRLEPAVTTIHASGPPTTASPRRSEPMVAVRR
jgi:hypothetical protein